jgi:5'-nucleotidase
LALSVILDKKPDLVVSGINKGANSGRTLLYSGTVGGIIEATMRHIPGIAFSCEDFDQPNYLAFESDVFPLVDYVLKHPLPKGTFLNVNFPSRFGKNHKGCSFARQGMGYYKESPVQGMHPDGWPYYWMGGCWEEHKEHEESDVHLLRQGFISVVPIHIHELTDLDTFHSRKTHFESLFQPN